MSRPRIASMILLLAAASVPLFATAQHGKSKPDPAQQAAWLRAAADSLRAASPERWPALKVREQDLAGGKRRSYKLSGRGCLPLEGNRHICFISTSSDTDPGVGDLILARDDRGKMALHRGHVCGGIIHFLGPANKPVQRLSDFTRWFRSDTDTLSWEVFKP